VAVTSQRKGRVRKARAGEETKRTSTVKSRNAPAKALADPRYRPRVVKGNKAYSRKNQARPLEDEDS